jgi:predicted Zn-dependent protease
MLFDLRSRGRRRTVQGVYLGLAVLMGGGLILFGVGAGNGFGGILNAFTGNGSGSAQKQVVSQQEKLALAAVKASPNDPAAWGKLVSARWTSATTQGSNFNPNTGAFTASGKKELTATGQAWQKYLTLTKKVDPTVAILAARAYAQLGDYANQAKAWELETLADPTQAKGYECLAASAYAAKQTRKGDLAAAKALTLVPKAQRLTIKQALQQAKTSPAVAQGC